MKLTSLQNEYWDVALSMSAGGNYDDQGLHGPLDGTVLDLIKLGSFTETNPESQ